MTTGFITAEDQDKITEAIRNAEGRTSGEIRVHLEKKCQSSVLDRAADLFADLGMHKTKLRNGVLFYFAWEDRKFAILGDAGINSVVPDNFWDDIKIRMQVCFRSGHFVEGICEGIEMAGKKLKEKFPRETDDENELSDQVSMS
jgi:uncharacterized membrane protein